LSDALEKAPYDIVIVGGGITGAGIARDAALRGLKVALFEKGDYGSGTSSKSSKLVHGGLRYLEHGEIGLVFESVSERRVQGKVAPHLVRPMPFLVPVYDHNKPGLEVINIGLWIYDTLALFRAHKMHKTFRGQSAVEVEPKLRRDGLDGAIEYYDCITDDARLVLENIIDAQGYGADCYSHTEVIGASREPTEDVIDSITVRDNITGETRTVRTHSIIVATGPWSDRLLRTIGVRMRRKQLLRPTKGVHIVFKREQLPLDRSITLISRIDGRVIFAIPWRDRTVIGTTDTDFDGDPDQVHADTADVEYLCKSANAYFPEANFKPEDVIATWAGLRPLIYEDEEHASDVSREHHVFTQSEGIITIAGGKLTTYRLMAKETVRAAIRWLKHHDYLDGRTLKKPGTKKRPLPGAQGLSSFNQQGVRAVADSLKSEFDLDGGSAEHLAWVYGTRAATVAELMRDSSELAERMESDLPYLWAEVVFAARHDLARTVDDVLARRIPLLLVGLEQGLDVAERVADVMAKELQWNDEDRERHLEHYRSTVAHAREYRS
jgi:glycerol-3-phosphate dehydrogenase